METRLPIPKNWQDFEMLCHKLWRDIWSDPNAQRNGRQGQNQNGVDIWGNPFFSRAFAGVQCKDKDERLGSELSVEELEKECAKAVSFEPSLRAYTVATTAPRDSSIQEHARSLTAQQAFPFPVSVWSWDDIEEEIRFRPTLIETYYSGFALDERHSGIVKVSPIAYRDQFEAFFSRPEIQHKIQPGLRRLLRSICYELCDNAFRHGHASNFCIVSEEDRIMFEDNGISFNPLIGLDSSKASAESHIGSHVFASFCDRFGEKLHVSYERDESCEVSVNRLILKFSEPTRRIVFQPTEVLVDMTEAFQRHGAEGLAATIKIPTDGTDLLLVIHDYFCHSAIVHFIMCLLRRHQSDTKLIFSLPRDNTTLALPRIFKDPRAVFIFR